MEKKLAMMEVERFAIHDGPGIRSTVFLQGCPLRCPWCANPESQTIGKKRMYYEKKCTGCGRCLSNCQNHALSVQDGKIIMRNLAVELPFPVENVLSSLKD